MCLASTHHPPPTSGLRRTCAGSAVDHLRTVRGGTHDETSLISRVDRGVKGDESRDGSITTHID